MRGEGKRKRGRPWREELKRGQTEPCSFFLLCPALGLSHARSSQARWLNCGNHIGMSIAWSRLCPFRRPASSFLATDNFPLTCPLPVGSPTSLHRHRSAPYKLSQDHLQHGNRLRLSPFFPPPALPPSSPISRPRRPRGRSSCLALDRLGVQHRDPR